MFVKHCRPSVGFERQIRLGGASAPRELGHGEVALLEAELSAVEDVAIISPDLGRDRFKEAVGLKLLTEHVDTNISPRPYSPEEIDESVRGTFLHDEILAKGKVVYSAQDGHVEAQP